MKVFKYIFLLGSVLFFNGCPARSLFPLFSEKETIFNPAFVGAWIESTENVTYLFQKGEGKTYSVIVCRESGDTSHYAAQLGKIGTRWFIDSYPSEDPSDFQLVPSRIISKIWLSGDTLIFTSLEGEYLEKLMETKTISTSYILHKGDIVLTAPTKELQQLVLRLSQDDKAFPNPTKLIRVK